MKLKQILPVLMAGVIFSIGCGSSGPTISLTLSDAGVAKVTYNAPEGDLYVSVAAAALTDVAKAKMGVKVPVPAADAGADKSIDYTVEKFKGLLEAAGITMYAAEDTIVVSAIHVKGEVDSAIVSSEVITLTAAQATALTDAIAELSTPAGGGDYVAPTGCAAAADFRIATAADANAAAILAESGMGSGATLTVAEVATDGGFQSKAGLLATTANTHFVAIACKLDTLAAGKKATVSIKVSAPAGGTYVIGAVKYVMDTPITEAPTGVALTEAIAADKTLVVFTFKPTEILPAGTKVAFTLNNSGAGTAAAVPTGDKSVTVTGL